MTRRLCHGSRPAGVDGQVPGSAMFAVYGLEPGCADAFVHGAHAVDESAEPTELLRAEPVPRVPEPHRDPVS